MRIYLSLFFASIAFCVAGIHLGMRPFWADESLSVLPALEIQRSFLPRTTFDMNFLPWQLKDGIWDPATPLYRYLVAFITWIFGFHETTTRGVSLLFGWLSIFPLFFLVSHLASRETAALTVLLYSWSVPTMEHSREARHFTMVVFFSLVTFLSLVNITTPASPEHTPVSRSQRRWAMLFIVGLWCALLTHATGTFVLPCVALYALVFWKELKPVFLRKELLAFAAPFLLSYLALMIFFWDTLPFFHYTGCDTHIKPGCKQERWLYLHWIQEFFQGRTFYTSLPFTPGKPLLLPFLFFGLFRGFLELVRKPKTPLLFPYIWLFIPLLYLTVEEPKFPRYLFEMSWAPLCFFTSFGLTWMLGLLPKLSLPLFALFSVFAIFQPLWDPGQRTLRSATRNYLQGAIFPGERDNFERIREQIELLKPLPLDNAILISSFDDASLSYYLKRRVYGLINRDYDDAFFVHLLEEAERKGQRVYFLDTLPFHDYCLTRERDPRLISCAVKYPSLYRLCKEGRSPCIHIPVYGMP